MKGDISRANLSGLITYMWDRYRNHQREWHCTAVLECAMCHYYLGYLQALKDLESGALPKVVRVTRDVAAQRNVHFPVDTPSNV